MKAAQIDSYGDPSIVEVREVERPVLGPGQVLVAVHAASLNPFDSKIREGYMKDSIPLVFPVTLGGDIAGVVAEVGEGAEGVTVGDRVYGQAIVVAGNSGALAEFAATKVGQIAAIPEGLSFEEAAALPLVGVSAWQALVQHIHLEQGQELFVHGGAGGIGSVAIQLAKHLGAEVATTATGEGVAYVRGLGADVVIDYKTQDFGAELHEYDAVFDAVGGDDFTKALGVLRQGGTGVSMVAQADAERVRELGVTAITQGTKITTEALEALGALVEAGAVKPQVDQVFALADIREAFETREGSEVRGKIVVKIA